MTAKLENRNGPAPKEQDVIVEELILLEATDLSWMAHKAFRTSSGKTPTDLRVQKTESIVGDSFIVSFTVRNLEMKKMNEFVRLFYDKTGTIIPQKDIRITMLPSISKGMTRDNRFLVQIIVDNLYKKEV